MTLVIPDCSHVIPDLFGDLKLSEILQNFEGRPFKGGLCFYVLVKALHKGVILE